MGDLSSPAPNRRREGRRCSRSGFDPATSASRPTARGAARRNRRHAARIRSPDIEESSCATRDRSPTGSAMCSNSSAPRNDDCALCRVFFIAQLLKSGEHVSTGGDHIRSWICTRACTEAGLNVPMRRLWCLLSVSDAGTFIQKPIHFFDSWHGRLCTASCHRDRRHCARLGTPNRSLPSEAQ